jgi:hypothetical protein
MLSWDEYDRENLKDELLSYARLRRETGVTSLGFLRCIDRNSVAIARATAALDQLDDIIEAEELSAFCSYGNLDDFAEYGDLMRAVHGLKSGSDPFFNIHSEYLKYSAARDVVSRIFTIFATGLLSARTCSLATVSRNAILRTPLFAYDAELSVVRHRLRAAL